MAYGFQNIIAAAGADNTNSILDDVNDLFNNGSSTDDFGYFQTSNFANVIAGQIIDRDEWDNIFRSVELAARHQGTVIGWSEADVTTFIQENLKITGGGAPTNTDFASLLSDISDVIANRIPNTDINQNLAGAMSGVTILNTTSPTATHNTSFQAEGTIDLISENNARKFFNTGGMITLNWFWNNTGSTTIGTQDRAAADVANVDNTSIGILGNGVAFGNTGTTMTNISPAFGFYDMPATYGTYYERLMSDNPYDIVGSEFTVEFRRPSTSTIEYQITLNDPAEPGFTDEPFSGNMDIDIDIRKPDGTIISAASDPTSGTPTFTQS